MRRANAIRFMFLPQASLLLAMALCAVVTPAQQSVAEGANLFAPSSQAAKVIDAARALPLTSFYSNDGVKPAARRTFVRSGPAADYALPPGVAATRIPYQPWLDSLLQIACFSPNWWPLDAWAFPRTYYRHPKQHAAR